MNALRQGLLAAFALGLAVSISLAEAALAALAVVLLLGRRASDGARLAWPLAAPVGAFAAWTLVSALASARPLESLVAAKTLLTLATLFIVVNALPDRPAVERFVALLLILVSLVGALGIVQVAACQETPPGVPLLDRFLRKCWRARGFYSIYMTLAGVLAPILIVSLPRLLERRQGLAWRLPTWLVGLAALGFTYVRGAWLGFAAGAVGCVLALRRGLRLPAILAVGAAVLLLSLGVLERSRQVDTHDASTRDRLIMLDVGFRMTRDHPVVGVGIGQVKHLYPVYVAPDAMRRRTSHLHNTPLQILVERGLPGLLLWGWIFAAFFRRAARTLGRLPPEAGEDRALVLGAIMAIAAFLVGGLTEYNFGDTEVLLVACSLMALPFVVERELDRSDR